MGWISKSNLNAVFEGIIYGCFQKKSSRKNKHGIIWEGVGQKTYCKTKYHIFRRESCQYIVIYLTIKLLIYQAPFGFDFEDVRYKKIFTLGRRKLYIIFHILFFLTLSDRLPSC